MGQKNFPEGVALGPPRHLSMSASTWACQPKPQLHGLSLSKSPIKNHAILFGSSKVIEPDQTKTRLHKAQHVVPNVYFVKSLDMC